MNQLKSGTLFVIVATFIASVLILTTTRHSNTSSALKKEVTEAATETKTSDADLIASTKAESQTTEEVKSEENKPEIIDTVVDKENNKTSEDSENTDTNKTDEATNQEVATLVAQTEPVEIKAPDGLYNNNPVETTTSSSSSDVTKTNKSDGKEAKTLEVEVSENPKVDDSIKPESIKPVATSTQTQHDLLNHLIQPIWMDQKLGDFKSVENGEIEFKLMPLTNKGIQGEDPKQVITKDNDKFAPTTVSADYNYQQMPMYNGGYYIAPMPQYLMNSVLPASSQNTD